MANQVIDKPVFVVKVRQKMTSLVRPITGILKFELKIESSLVGSVYEVARLNFETELRSSVVGRLNPMIADLKGRTIAQLSDRPISEI